MEITCLDLERNPAYERRDSSCEFRLGQIRNYTKTGNLEWKIEEEMIEDVGLRYLRPIMPFGGFL
ncbi:hypothetical protein L484_017778 [Morus notabilis]|uniref:Uncharacterized protein n=1 Tax=Morus notabilis TaxID=981085 RepID=W9RBF6_9ROSA|nr:hypothetical protein L484_017778 [Morus notabilis]